MSITSIVGRDPELAAFAGFLERVPDGPSAMLIAGEAGIGKTTVWRHAVERARARGLTVLVTRPNEAETRLPYAGLGDLLADIDDTDLAGLPTAQRQAIEVALLRAEPGVEPLEQRAVGVGVHAILRRSCARNPVLIAVDDAQWLDRPSAGVLQFALRRLDGEALGVLASVRAHHGRADVLGLGAALPPDAVETVHVTALAIADIDRLLHDRLGVGLAGATLRRVHELSGGNPFYALEIGRALLRQGAAAFVGLGLPIPDTLRELVLERLYRLPGPARDVLLVVAALTRPTLGTVRAALGADARIETAIGRAEDAGVIELDGDEIRFSHPLLGSVLHSETGPDVRRRLHRRLADVVDDADERARHLALGTIEPDEAIAAELEAAAVRTHARGAPDAAAALADQARRLTPVDRSAEMARRTLAASTAFLEAGANVRAVELLEPLAASASGPDRARALLILARVRTYAEGLRSAEPLLEQAAAVAGDDPLLQAAIGRDLTTALTQTGDLRRAESGARRTIAWAEQTGQEGLVVAALVQLAMVEFLLGHGVRADLLGRAADLHPVEDHPTSLAAALAPVDLVWGAVLKWSDAFDSARERFDDLHRRALAAGDETAWSSLLFQAGELELWAGNWERSQAMATELESAAERRPPSTRQDHAYLVAALQAHRGEVGEARATAIAALEQTDLTGDLRFRIRAFALLGFLELSAGAAPTARTHLEQAWTLFRDAAYDDPGVVRFVPDLIEARVLVGEAAAAGALVDWLEERGRTLDRPYALATAGRSRAIVLGSAGRVDDGLTAIQEALDHHRRLAQPFELGRTQLVAGGLLRRARAKRDAREALTAALAIFRSLGARSWAERASAELGRIGGRAATTTGLTSTESRVAELAAEGYGNQEIAERLFVSNKTVEAHLTRIYDKLGVRSRGELARRSRSGEFPDVGGRSMT